jgi:hypothetical protein
MLATDRSRIFVTDSDERVKRIYALAETFGRLAGETHNLAADLAAKMAARRADTRTTAHTQRRAERPKKS